MSNRLSILQVYSDLSPVIQTVRIPFYVQSTKRNDLRRNSVLLLITP